MSSLPPIPKNPTLPKKPNPFSVHVNVDPAVWEMARILRAILGPPQQSMSKWMDTMVMQYVDHHMKDPAIMEKIERELRRRRQKIFVHRVRQPEVDVEAFWKNALRDEGRHDGT